MEKEHKGQSIQRAMEGPCHQGPCISAYKEESSEPDGEGYHLPYEGFRFHLYVTVSPSEQNKYFPRLQQPMDPNKDLKALKLPI